MSFRSWLAWLVRDRTEQEWGWCAVDFAILTLVLLGLYWLLWVNWGIP